MQVVHPRNFYPVSWYECNDLWTPGKSSEEWQEFFALSTSVDFFSSSCGSGVKVNKPRFYGSALPAYAYLAPRHCPLAFETEKFF